MILNLYKRGHRLAEQIHAVRGQSHPVTEIILWENGEPSVPGVSTDLKLTSSRNLGVWARFTAALNAQGSFVWMIDDDTIPGARFLENALETFNNNPGIIGSRGLLFRTPRSYTLYDEVGPLNPVATVTEVDIVGHNWVFPTDWLGAFWAEYPNRFDHPLAGEDMHLSFSVQKHLGFGTFVPPHPIDAPEMWGDQASQSKGQGADEFAISRSPASMKRFEDAYRHYVDLGFQICKSRSEGSEIPLADSLAAEIVRRHPFGAQRVAQLLNLKKKSQDLD